MVYVPLGIKTDYSLLKSIIKIDDLINMAVKNKFNTIGILDNNLFSLAEFYLKCQKNKIKPIVGLEVLLNEYPIYLYPKNNRGLRNLFLIHDLIFERELTTNDLELHSDNIILVLPYDSYRLYKELNSIFNEVYLSYENDQEKQNALLISKEVLFLNKVLYFNPSDADLINYLKMIELGENSENYSLENYQTNRLLSDSQVITEDKETTIKFSSLIDLNWVNKKNYLPHYETKNKDNYEFLKELSIFGLKKRLNDKVSDQYKERLIYELEIIKRMDFVSYFLIVYDYVFYAKKNNIIVGPGRGSAASSLVAYSLGITNIDPLKYGLLFERFLNVERISMPDIDLDFEDHRRDEVKSYIENKYGSSKSASIITFSTLGSKQVIRDLGKIFMVSDELINKLLKEINSKYNLRLNYDNNPHIKDLTTSNDKLKRVYAVGIKLEGLKKLISTHAAGMVISADNLNTLIPMYKTPETYLTGVTMDYLEDYGLLKMDLLALNNLTIIGNCLKLISDLDINNIPLDDKKTFELFASGNTASIFQFESEGMKKFLTKLKPSSFSDLYAAVALYRPGPMGNIDTFIDRKQGRVKIDYLHPNLETILKETYGIIVYQEQIMKILSILAGYSLAESDIVRKGVSKKNLEYLEKEKNRFISGCLKNGYDLKLAEKVFELILKFAAYGFNKAHSVSYALISYQLGYLKANYPNEFYTTLLNMSLGSITKIKELLDNLRAANVKVKDFDLFKSKDIFYIDNGFIYLPLTLIKGIDKNTYEIIMKIISKENNDIYMFMNNAYENNLGKDIIVNLIKMGLLSSFNLNRNTLLTNLDSLLDYAELAHNLDESLVEKPLIEEVPEMEIGELLASEIELCGFYISDHPTNEYFKKGNMKLNEKEKNFDKFVDVVVIVEKIKEIKTKKNEDMAFITASDDTGSMEFILFPNRFNLLNSIHLNKMLIISGKVTRKNDKYGIIINRVKNIGEI